MCATKLFDNCCSCVPENPSAFSFSQLLLLSESESLEVIDLLVLRCVFSISELELSHSLAEFPHQQKTVSFSDIL